MTEQPSIICNTNKYICPTLRSICNIKRAVRRPEGCCAHVFCDAILAIINSCQCQIDSMWTLTGLPPQQAGLHLKRLWHIIATKCDKNKTHSKQIHPPSSVYTKKNIYSLCSRVVNIIYTSRYTWIEWCSSPDRVNTGTQSPISSCGEKWGDVQMNAHKWSHYQSRHYVICIIQSAEGEDAENTHCLK